MLYSVYVCVREYVCHTDTVIRVLYSVCSCVCVILCMHAFVYYTVCTCVFVRVYVE